MDPKPKSTSLRLVKAVEASKPDIPEEVGGVERRVRKSRFAAEMNDFADALDREIAAILAS